MASGILVACCTGETNLVGTLVQQATKMPLATYLAEKVWGPAGMEQQAT